MLNVTATARINRDCESASTSCRQDSHRACGGEEETMYDKIVVGYDGSSSSGDALALAESLARASHGGVVVVNVYERYRYEIPQPGYASWEQFLREEAENLVRGALNRARKEGSVPSEHLKSMVIGNSVRGASSPARGLHELAEELEADLIVVGASNRSRIGQALVGSTAQRLLHGSHCPVCVAPAGYAKSKRTATHVVAVGYDDSPEAMLALDLAWRTAAAGGGRVRVLSVAKPPSARHGKGPGAGQGYQELEAAIEETIQQELDEAVGKLPDNVETDAVLLHGDPATELCEAAADADLLCMGSRGYGPFSRVLMGSVSSAVIEASVCPVVITPRGVEADADAEPALAASGHES